MKNFIVKSDKDNVGNALEPLDEGDEVAWSKGANHGQATVKGTVPFGFKMALRNLPGGADVVSYGEVIGTTSRSIRGGECVHVHNMVGKRGNSETTEGRE